MKTSETINEALLVSLFRLGPGLFGIPAAEIQEVVQVGSLTPVHHAPSWVVGIRNLRGRIITVVDLGSRLGLGCADIGPESRILILDVENELVGLLVDKVEDTIFIETEAMSAAPSKLPAVEGAAVRGVYPCCNGLATLLDHRPILIDDKSAAKSR